MPYRPRRMRVVQVGLATFVLLFAAAVGFLFGRSEPAESGGGADSAAAAATEWTCSMHPQIRLPQFGQCPICFMDLIPVTSGGMDADLPQLQLSARARELARVETAVVERRELIQEVRMVGKVAPDETRITYVSSYVPGRLDRLFVNYTGILVRRGDHLAEIYSPELLIAQREYVMALEAAEKPAGAAGPGGNRPQRERSMLCLLYTSRCV